jgi:cation:H+ antiporter
MLAAVEIPQVLVAWLPALAVLGGLIGLVGGADRFVSGASGIATRLGMSPLMVGMLIVGVGTSSPEMLVSATAAYGNNGGIAVGNAIGSNISNIGLVLGVTALVAPIPLDRGTVRTEFPILLAVSAAGWLLFVDGDLDRTDGAILVTAFLLVLVRMLRAGDGTAEEPLSGTNVFADLFWLVVGLALLMAGSRGIVWGATEIAREMGISDLVIGLTIVAIGTSLPELAASVAAAMRREHALALGNVIGSNTFNLVAVLPFPALMDPGPVEAAAWQRDYPVMIGFTLTLVAVAWIAGRRGRLGRRAGLLFVGGFASYMTLLVLGGG